MDIKDQTGFLKIKVIEKSNKMKFLEYVLNPQLQLSDPKLLPLSYYALLSKVVKKGYYILY